MVKKIRDTTGLDSIQVEDGEVNKKVVLRGSQKEVADASAMILEVLAEVKKSAAARSSTAIDRPPAPSPAPQGGKGAGKSSSKLEAAPATKPEAAMGGQTPDGEKPRPSAFGKPQTWGPGKVHKAEVNLESQDLFPTLGATTNGTKGKSLNKNGAWPTENGGVEKEDKTDEALTATQEASS